MDPIIRSALRWLQVTLLLHLLYLWVPAIAAVWRRVRGRPASGPSARSPRVAVLIPAHNEDAVLGNLLADLDAQTYPAFRVYVVADNSSDATADIARRAGANCVERFTPGEWSTKHKALHHLWETERENLAESDAVLLLDADHRIPPDFIATLVACDKPVVQVDFREDLEGDSNLASLDAISRVVSHQLAEAGRVQLRLSALLAGSGMLFDRAVFQRLIERPTQTIVEDREWQLHLACEGVYVHWTDATFARSEPIGSVAVLETQRGRWLRGRWHLVLQMGGRVLLAGLRRADLNLLDKLYDQVQPPRSLVGLALAGLAALSVLPVRVRGLWPVRSLLLLSGAFAAYFPLGLVLAGAPRGAYLALLRAPFFMVRMTIITLVSLVSRRYDTWIPTRHRGV